MPWVQSLRLKLILLKLWFPPEPFDGVESGTELIVFQLASVLLKIVSIQFTVVRLLHFLQLRLHFYYLTLTEFRVEHRTLRRLLFDSYSRINSILGRFSCQRIV